MSKSKLQEAKDCFKNIDFIKNWKNQDEINTYIFEKLYYVYQPEYDLLKKYINHVLDCEGSDFLQKLNSSESEVKFTDKDVEKLMSF